MPKLILILGPGRTGKTTLARLLRAELPNYNLLHADAVRAAIIKDLPKKYPEELLHYEQNSYYASLLLGLVREQLHQDQDTQGFILDGGVISPQFLTNHPLMAVYQPIALYLGHGDLDAEGIFKLIRENDISTDWSSQLDDATLRAKTTYFAKQNQTYRAECSALGVKYVDTSKDRPLVLSRLKQEILQSL